jgi:hypothetical protein
MEGREEEGASSAHPSSSSVGVVGVGGVAMPATSV